MNLVEKLLNEKDNLSREEIYNRIEEITGIKDMETNEAMFYKKVQANKLFLDRFTLMRDEMIKKNPYKRREIESIFSKTIEEYRYNMNLSADMVKLILDIKPKKMRFISKIERNCKLKRAGE